VALARRRLAARLVAAWISLSGVVRNSSPCVAEEHQIGGRGGPNAGDFPSREPIVFPLLGCSVGAAQIKDSLMFAPGRVYVSGVVVVWVDRHPDPVDPLNDWRFCKTDDVEVKFS